MDYNFYKIPKSEIKIQNQNMNYEYKIFKPSIIKIFPKWCKTIDEKLKFIFMLYKSKFSLCVFYATQNEKLVGYGYISKRTNYYSFMKKNEIFIGPVNTIEKYRRTGVAQSLIMYISQNLNFENAWWVAASNNIASNNVCRKCGFVLIGKGICKRKKFLLNKK